MLSNKQLVAIAHGYIDGASYNERTASLFTSEAFASNFTGENVTAARAAYNDARAYYIVCDSCTTFNSSFRKYCAHCGIQLVK
jgi:hypothetical protein